jgi:single-strand DNA-binding protein
LVGRLTQDPEVKYTQAGKAVASFTLAVNRFGDNKEADFIPIVAWEKLAELCGNNLNKGSKVLIEGRMQVRSYETTDGQKRRVTEVVTQTIEFLDAKKQSDNSTPFGGQVLPEEEVLF